MKLIRITSSNPDGSFENLFSTDIEIQEKSKIALRNITFQTEGEQFILDGTNNLISFTIAGNTLSHSLQEITVTNDNINDFIKDIQDGLNNSLQFIGKQISTQFRVRIKDGLFEIGYLNSPYDLNNNFFSMIPENCITFSSTGAGTLMKSTDNTNVTNDTRKYVSNIPFCKGGAVSRIKIQFMDNSPPDDNSGFFLGVSRTDRKNFNNDSMSGLEKDLWIHAPKLGGSVYRFGYIDSNGTPHEDPTTRQVTLGDVVEIRRVEGRIILGVYDAVSETFEQFYSHNDLTNETWTNYLIFRTKNGAMTLLNFRNTLDPTRMNLTGFESSDFTDSVGSLGVIPRPSPQLSVNNTLSFGSKSLMEFLGYNTRDGLSKTIRSKTPSFFGDELFTLAIFNDTYLVVLDNFDLESYDGFLGNRKSILEIIPSTDDNTNRIIQYEPNNLNFVDIKNLTRKNIRNIKGRILKGDLTKPKLKGLTSITLLVDG